MEEKAFEVMTDEIPGLVVIMMRIELETEVCFESTHNGNKSDYIYPEECSFCNTNKIILDIILMNSVLITIFLTNS